MGSLPIARSVLRYLSMRLCRNCNQIKTEQSFRKGQSGGTRNTCRKCESIQRGVRKEADPVGTYTVIRRRTLKLSAMRRTGIDIERFIFEDAKKEDRKRGYDFDLTKSWIKDQIAHGCSYCGNTGLRMTLDRIDNTVGHTKDNVVPACIRCNYLRRNIPYEAWLVLVPAVKKAVESGLFGDWTGRTRYASAI